MSTCLCSGARRPVPARVRTYGVTLAAIQAAAIACDSGAHRGQIGEPPETVSVSGQAMTSGFAGGVLRETTTVDAFSITKYPITRADYSACVQAKACEATDGTACAADARSALGARTLDDPKSPEVCVTVEQAAGYCRWVHGRLPRLAEWLLAARGTAPQRFPWGDAAPTCDQHVRAQDRPIGAPSIGEGHAECSASGPALVVGEHAAGAAPSGIEDVLIVPGELLASQSGAQFAACDQATAACFVYGSAPGALESVFPIERAGEPEGELGKSPHVYGFRCVLEEG